MYYVYILKSQVDKRLYIGVTNDLKRRFKQHNSGSSTATEYRKPFLLIYYEAYRNKSDAYTRESKLKKFKNSYSTLKKRIAKSLDEGLKD